MDGGTFRMFIAVPLDREIIRELSFVQEELRRRVGGVKWVAPENLHITLKFLGDVPYGMIDAIGEAMGYIAPGTGPFQVSLCGIGAFPKGGPPRVIWAGIREGEAELAGLWERLDRKLLELSIERDRRPFAPHITIGRVKEGSWVPPGLLAGYEEAYFGSMNAGCLRLMRSQLDRRGPTYSVLREITF